MKAAFGAEAIGLGHQLAVDALLAPFGVRARDPLNPRPWVAEIVGQHPRYGYERRFLRPRIDYRKASSTANRGVWFWWTLESGHIYEASCRTSWNSGQIRRFVTVTEDGDIKDLTREEVDTWLSARSASTS